MSKVRSNHVVLAVDGEQGRDRSLVGCMITWCVAISPTRFPFPDQVVITDV